jgi:hypothetical protein
MASIKEHLKDKVKVSGRVYALLILVPATEVSGSPLRVDSGCPLWLRLGHDAPDQHELRLSGNNRYRGGRPIG